VGRETQRGGPGFGKGDNQWEKKSQRAGKERKGKLLKKKYQTKGGEGEARGEPTKEKT